MQIGPVSWESRIAKNWAIHKPSILAALAAAALGTVSLKVNYDFPIQDADHIIPKFTLLAASGIVAVESVVYLAQRILSKKNNEAFIMGPALTAVGAALIFAAGHCPALDFPSAAFAALNGATLSWYGIWWTAAAHLHQDHSDQECRLPI